MAIESGAAAVRLPSDNGLVGAALLRTTFALGWPQFNLGWRMIAGVRLSTHPFADVGRFQAFRYIGTQ